jgi:fructose-1,6-bisphosphatase/inositol monophosphatase family enzyme
MPINSVENLLNCIKTAGEMAIEEQRVMNFFDRGYKDDGSVVTLSDKKIDDYLFECVANLYPDANIITEETTRPFSPQKPYTFAIDPIDGTDMYSQGMSGWCVSLGLLNDKLLPIAGIIYSPSLKLLFFADVGKEATVNGKHIVLRSSSDASLASSNIMVPATIHKQADLRKYPGRIRSIGSAALHLCFPLIYPGMFAAIESRGAHIWDIAGAHAINLSLGSDFELCDGRQIDYSLLVNGSVVGSLILAGSKQRVDVLRNLVVTFHSD